MTDVPEVTGERSTINIERLKGHSFEIGPIRPPSEGGSFSLLLRVTRNCPWSKCGFCYGSLYNHERFELRSVEEVKADIDSVKAISDELKALSWKLGYAGKVEPLAAVIQNSLSYGRGAKQLTDDEVINLQSIVNVFNWLCFGGKTVFLQDADTLIMHTNQLVEVIRYLKEAFPDIERITSYARSKSIVKKKPEELSQLRQAGLSRLHIGLETGDDELLSYVNKGVTSEEHILAGKKAIEAGFELSEYVMPGLGGRSKWIQHAKNTARVLNEINPHFIRLRPFIPRYDTPMFQAYEKGEFELTSPHERLQELELMIENLQVTSRVCFDHSLNPSYRSGGMLVPLLKQDYSGYKFPQEKEMVLELIKKGLQMDEAAFVDARDLIGIPM
ncbi:MAG: radical SAM protein [Chloroflexota bacterium]